MGLTVIDDGILGLGIGSLVGGAAVESNCDGEDEHDDQANRDGHLLSILAKSPTKTRYDGGNRVHLPRKGNIRDNQQPTTNDRQPTTDNGGGRARRHPLRWCTAVPQASRWRSEATINRQGDTAMASRCSATAKPKLLGDGDGNGDGNGNGIGGWQTSGGWWLRKWDCAAEITGWQQ